MMMKGVGVSDTHHVKLSNTVLTYLNTNHLTIIIGCDLSCSNLNSSLDWTSWFQSSIGFIL